jgi:transcriptional regulator with XRE-family HTH domain
MPEALTNVWRGTQLPPAWIVMSFISKVIVMESIGDRITRMRQEKGYSVAELAQLVGVKEETLKDWESDERDPRANRLLRLSGALDVPFSWLMVGDESGVELVAGTDRLSTMETKLNQALRLQGELAELLTSLQGDIAVLRQREEELNELADLEDSAA